MESVTLQVRDLDPAAQAAVERLLGQPLAPSQEFVIRIVAPTPQNGSVTCATDALPEWCDVFAGLSEAEIRELQSSMVRSPLSREFE